MSDTKVFRAFMTQDNKTVTLKIGSREACQNAIDAVSGAPGITRIGMERIRNGGEKNEHLQKGE